MPGFDYQLQKVMLVPKLRYSPRPERIRRSLFFVFRHFGKQVRQKVRQKRTANETDRRLSVLGI